MPADEVVVTSVVGLPVERAFTTFTEEIDRWWQRAPSHDRDAVVQFDSDQLVAISPTGSEVLATVTSWNPPRRLDLAWRGPNAEPGDVVVIEFDPEPPGTRVTVRHKRRGLSPESVEAAVAGLWWGNLVSRLVDVHRPQRQS